MKKVFLTVGAVISLAFVLFAQDSNTTYNAGLSIPEDRIRSSDEGFASEEFRRGVQAYYKGSYNESIVALEKALSYLPDDNLILEWLGKAYYKAGMEGAALSYWKISAENGYGGLVLQNKLEIVRERRVTGDTENRLMKLSEAGSYGGINGDKMIFSGPTSALPNKDGTIWITSYNTNEVLLLNINGFVIKRVTGPLNGFDRPLDIVRLSDGNLLVSESAGDRLSLLKSNGNFIKYIGSKGRGVGNLVGPQYIAVDSLERIYVSDYGNRRIDVFDKEGNGLYYFGGKQPGFDGLKGPTGIAVIDDSVFVADDYKGCIYEFDKSGNYIRELVEENTFIKPESLRFWQNSLTMCDKNKIYSVDIQTGALFEYTSTGNAPSRVTNATVDANNNLLATDFTSNEVYIMSKTQELVGGLFVQIEQVDASKFPNVTVEVKVENRHRQPVVGLQAENFFFTENKRPVTNLKYIGSVNNNDYGDITIIIDRSYESNNYKNEIETAVNEIVSEMNGRGTLRVISAGEIPFSEYVGKPDLLGKFNLDALKNKPSENTSIDLAFRLASNELIGAAKKRSIVFITDGKVSYTAFDKYNLSELCAYVNNNSIGVSVVQVSQQSLDSEYNYIIDNTRGDLYYVFRPEGLSAVVKDSLNLSQGTYQLSYVSTLQTNFGERFLPLETEVYLMNRSGRDESGYFAPLH